jgi:hypothetical protein
MTDTPTYDLSIHQNPDAQAWAKFFVKTFPDTPHDEETMCGWFANAMMAMHDHVKGISIINGDHAQFVADEAKRAAQ